MTRSLPSSWPEWDVTDKAIEDMGREFPTALYGGIPRNVSTGADVVRLEQMIGKAEVTRILAGTDDRKSKAWKSALRQQQRYRRGERGVKGIAADRSEKLTTAARNAARNRFVGAPGPLNVRISVRWVISRDSKKSTPEAPLAGEALAAFKTAVTGGQYVRAIQIVTWAWGLDPSEVVELQAVHGVRIG